MENQKHYLEDDSLPVIRGPPLASAPNNRSSKRMGSSIFGSEYERTLDLEQAKNNCTQTLKSFLTRKFFIGLTVWLCMIGGFGYLYISGLLLEISNGVEDLGFAGSLIFIGIFILVAQPFAWGFSATIISVGFIYGWLGAVIVLVGSLLGATITFFEVRYFARDYLQSRIDKMEPRLQLVTKQIERSATKTVCSSYPILIGIRSSPLTFGITNSMFALTTVTYARYIATAFLSFFIAIPLNINLGVVTRQISDIGGGSSNENKTAEELALEEQSNLFNTISLVISIVVSIIVVIVSVWYGNWVMKKVDNLSEDEIVKEIVQINNEANEDDQDLGFKRESVRLSFRKAKSANQLSE